MKRPDLSIRTILLATFGALTLTIAMFSAVQLFEDGRRIAAIGRLKAASAVSDRIIEASEALSLERDIALSLLNASDAATAQALRPRLEEARRGADASLARVSAALAQDSDPRLTSRIDRLKASADALRALRAAIDASLPARALDAALVRRWSDRMSIAVEDAQALRLLFVARYVGVDATATLHLSFKNMLRSIRDHFGQERSTIGQLIARDAAPSAAETAALLRGQGAMDEAWRVSRSLAEQSGLLETIAPAYADARSHYATMQGMLRDAFLVPGRAAAFPISADLWFELSTQAFESLQSLTAATRRAAQAHLDRLLGAAEERLALHAALFLLAALLCAACLWVVMARVIRPINAIVEALVKTVRGERATFAVSAGRSDEIGKLSAVLRRFQETWEEARRAAGELDRSERRLRAVVNNAVDGLITIDAKGVIHSFNPACERIFGYAAAEVIGRSVSTLMPEPDRHQHDSYLARYAGSGEARVIGAVGRELMAQRKDGSVFPIDLSISGIALPEGTFFSGIIRDITARRQAEQALLSHTRALERSNKELDDFAYIASHDLKEPLRGIHNHARFLLEDNADKLGEDSAKRLHRLVYLSQRMERLVNDLLYFSRLGRQELAFQATDLNALVHDVEATLDHFLEERAARVVLPAALPTIICDKPRVAEVFRNLVTNAAKYNDRPEKLIEIGFLAQKIRRDGACVRNVFYVKDNGCGVDPEFHEEIFRIFKRLQGAHGAQEGTGVGLTFVKKIVERHGGTIWIESERGSGATFFFTLESRDNAEYDAKAA
jgi:PAS domain S-box-containing protein